MVTATFMPASRTCYISKGPRIRTALLVFGAAPSCGLVLFRLVLLARTNWLRAPSEHGIAKQQEV